MCNILLFLRNPNTDHKKERKCLQHTQIFAHTQHANNLNENNVIDINRYTFRQNNVTLLVNICLYVSTSPFDRLLG